MNNGVTNNNQQPNQTTTQQPTIIQTVSTTTPATQQPVQPQPQTQAQPVMIAQQPEQQPAPVETAPAPVAAPTPVPPAEAQPVIEQTTTESPAPEPQTPDPAATPEQTVENQTPEQNSTEEPGATTPAPKARKKLSITPILVFFLFIAVAYIVYQNQATKKTLEKKDYECSPVSANKETKLDLNSSLVKDLYSKVATSIREDLASVELNDTMKLYLAYRQIVPNKIYDSNCNLFDSSATEPYTCEVTPTFTPKAFKEETLQLEVKKLFGEKANIPNGNIQLGKLCIGGYQYIPQRGEYVQGFCEEFNATTYSVDKKVVAATSTQNVIKITEEVKYYGNEKTPLPEYLKSGQYVYTFKLDTNYNYVYVNKEFKENY